MKKSIILLMFVVLLCTALSSQTVAEISDATVRTISDLSGSGTEADPYLITTLDDLITISTNQTLWSKHFIQTANIDASSTATLNEGAGFSPIGKYPSNYFTGSYNGNNYTISNLYINRPNSTDIGLFGSTNGASISNVGLEDNEIIGGQDSIGGLVGYSTSYSTISNSYATGAVSGTERVGGLVGQSNSTISNSYATGAVSGTSDVGGLVGYRNGGSVSNSFWDRETTGQTSSQGGTGKTTQQMKDINTYLTAGWDFIGEDVNGTDDIWWISSSINSGYPCFNIYISNMAIPDKAINVSLTPTISLEVDEIFVAYELYFGNTPNPETAIISFSQITNPVAYTFTQPLEYLTDYYWTLILYDANYEVTTLNFTFKTRPSFDGLGTEADPYQIATLNDLIDISEHSMFWNQYIVQTADIDASSTATLNEGAGFSPLGNVDLKFTGSYDGNGYTISNLKINRPDTNYVGLFGYTYTGNILNVSLIDNEIIGQDYVGSLVGYSYESSSISNSYATGPVSGVNYVGGLTGYSYVSSTISNSYATGSVEGNNYVGGLTGRSSESIISDSYATGHVNGSSDHIGGLAGYSSSPISNSYATGSVIGSHRVGGLTGYSSSPISNSYATGDVTGASNYIGGLTGYSYNYCQINNSYASGAVSGYQRVGGLVGYSSSTTSTITNSHATGSVSGTSNYVGGLIGYSASVINNSYATGTVSSSSSYAGGLVGYKNSGSVANSFWDMETTGQTTSTGGTGKTTQQMTNLYTYLNAGWDFLGEEINGTEDIWYIHPGLNSGYPYIINEQQITPTYLPNYAVSSYPINEETNLATSDNLVWQPDFLEMTTGYRFNLGTDNPPTGVVANLDLGLVTAWEYSNLLSNTTYYWQVIPYNINGNAEDCPIWSFTTGSSGLINVGTGVNTDAQLPIDFNQNKSYSQSIYLQSELNLANRDIAKLAFYLIAETNFVGANQWKVYLGHTDKTEFSTSNDWLLANQGLTEVASVTLDNTIAAGWLEIELTAPFAYNNVDNLIVGVMEYSPALSESTTNNFYTTTTDTNRSLLFGHETITPNLNIPYGGVISTSIPKINFTFSESTTRFTGLVQNSQNQPLTNANIYIEEFGTFPTNSLGEFNIHNVEAGTYQLTISAPWYEAQFVDFEVLEGQDNYLEITLLEELLPANSVIATLAEDLSSVTLNWTAPTLGRVAKAGKKAELNTRSGQPNVTYNLYRYILGDEDIPENWLEVAVNLNALTYVDASFPGLELGSYCWAVEAVYYNDRLAVPTHSNEIVKQPYLESDIAEQLDFGIVYLTNSSEYSEIILTNTGTGNLTISEISCADSAFNLVYDNAAWVVEPNATYTISVNFAPEHPAVYTAELLINNNSSSEPNLAIALRGVCEYVPPVNPDGVQVNMVGNSANISWAAVTEDIYQNPITPDLYIVYFNGLNTEDDNHFYYLGHTAGLSYSHPDVGVFSEFMFYRVKAYVDVDHVILSNIQSLVSQKRKVSQEEIEKLIRK